MTTTTEVENFPGYPDGTTGFDLMEDLRRQAVRFGADVRPGIIKAINLDKRPFHATAEDGTEIVADTVIISTGATAKYLGLPDEERFSGTGVSACATCDGFFYRGKRVAVVGGGDTACEEALYLSNLASQVFMIVRKDYLRASKVMQKRVLEKSNITVLFNTNTIGLYGNETLEGANLIEGLGTPREQRFDLAIDGFFLAIGHTPNTGLFNGKLHTDEAGYLKTYNGTTATNIPGVFAAGDVADPRYRQAITAAGTGCRAALDAERFITEN